MTAETFMLLVVAAGAAYWYWRKMKPEEKSAPQCQPPAQPSNLPTRDSEEVEPFLHAVALEKERTDSAINVAQQQYERELETRFADDVKVKERLSKFARDNELDRALTDLWQEVRHYPAWSSRDDFEKCNKLHLTGISGSKNGEIDFVEFAHGEQRFKVTEKRWYGMEGESYSDISFFEDSKEVFAVNCSIHDEYDVDVYRCHGVSAFKKRGNWARVLLEYYAQIQIERNQSSAKFKYFRAEEIKSRFEE